MGKGIPTFGDRSAWDALTYAIRHANDIDNGVHWTLTKLQELFAAVGHTHAHFTDTSNPHSVTKVQVGLGNVANVLCNLTGTAAPGVNDDSAAGYSVGSWWFYNNKYYDCLDATSGAAVWQERGSGSGGSITVEEADGTPSVASVSKIKVPNGSLTDNGSGVVTLASVGGTVYKNILQRTYMEQIDTISHAGQTNDRWTTFSWKIVAVSNARFNALTFKVMEAGTYTVEIRQANDTTVIETHSLGSLAVGDTTVTLTTPINMLAGQTYYIHFTASAAVYFAYHAGTPVNGVCATISTPSSTNVSPSGSLDFDLYIDAPIDITT